MNLDEHDTAQCERWTRQGIHDRCDSHRLMEPCRCVNESLLIPMLTFASLVLAYRIFAAPYLHNNLPSSLVLPSSFLTKHFTACAFHR